MANISIDMTKLVSARVVKGAEVNTERDRRTEGLFVFAGKYFQLDAKSQRHITAKGAQAKFAVLSGAVAGDLRWANPDQDFAWIATDNSIVPMDAQTMAAFANAADLWVTGHIMAGAAIKVMNPIPTDVTADALWPTVD